MACLLITDIDGTLIGQDDALAKFNDLWTSHFLPLGGKLVYNTGRSVDSFIRLLKRTDGGVIVPDSFICNNGTTICSWPNGIDEPPKYDGQWSAALSAEWDKEKVRKAANTAAAAAGYPTPIGASPKPEGNNSSRVALKTLGAFGLLEGVADEGMAGAFKYGLMMLTAGTPEEREEALQTYASVLRSELAKAGVSVHCDVSWLFAEPHTGPPTMDDWATIDLVPTAAGKGNATRFVREQIMRFDEARTVVFGDSGNDIAMFAEGSEGKGVMVGNTESILLEWHNEGEGAAAKEAGRHFHAEAFSAGGMAEGLLHFGLVPEPGRGEASRVVAAAESRSAPKAKL